MPKVRSLIYGGAVGAAIDLPDIEGLDDILELDTDDLESDDVEPDEV